MVDIPDSPGTYDAALVLGARVQRLQHEIGGSFYWPTSYTQSDKDGMLAGEFRMHGALALYFGSLLGNDLPNIKGGRFIFAGGVSVPVNASGAEDVGVVPTEAEVYANSFEFSIGAITKFLQNRAPQSWARPTLPEIILEKGSMTTAQGVKAMVDVARERGLESVLVLTNNYHVARVRAMTARILQAWRGGRLAVNVASAEAFASAFGPEQVALHLDAYFSSNPHQRMIADRRRCAEAHGLYALAAEAYNDPAGTAAYTTFDMEQRDALKDRWRSPQLLQAATG